MGLMLVSAVLIADYSGGAHRAPARPSAERRVGSLSAVAMPPPTFFLLVVDSSVGRHAWPRVWMLLLAAVRHHAAVGGEGRATPYRLLALNLSGSAGEMFFPYLIGLFFERRRFASLGIVLVLLEAAVVFSTVAAWCIARKKAHKSSPWRRGVAGEMGGYFGGSTSTGATSEDRDQLEPMLPLSTADGRSMEVERDQPQAPTAGVRRLSCAL